MGILSWFEKKQDGSATVLSAAPPDPENQYPAKLENGDNGLTTASYHITSKMEKHLIRKLDRRLVPLVMGLCMII